MNTAKTVEAAVIGAGPSGLTSALTLGRVRRSVLVFNTGIHRNNSADEMHTVPSNEGKNPRDYLKEVRAELAEYTTVKILDDTRIESVTKEESGEFLLSSGSQSWRAKNVVLATGVKDKVPTDIPGFTENWGKGIIHCLYCHGYEFHDRTAAVIGTDIMAALSVLYSLPIFKDVTVFGNGPLPPQQVIEKLEEKFPRVYEMLKVAATSIDLRKIERITSNPDAQDLDKRMTVHFTDGTSESRGILLHVPPTVQAADFADKLQLKRTPMGDIELTTLQGTTSVDGVFAAGDAASMVKQIPHATYSGVLAANGVHHRLTMEEMVKRLNK